MTATTITFNSPPDNPLNQYPSIGAPDWAYLIEGGGATVNSGAGVLQFPGFTGTPMRARYIGAGTTTGDQKITITGLVKNGNEIGALGRCQAGADTCYVALIETGQTNCTRLYRIVAGDDGGGIPLAAWNDTLTPGTHSISIKVTGSGASIDIEVQTNANTVHTFSDTSGARLTSGQPGIFGVTDENYPNIDNVVVDDLAAGGPTLSSPVPSGTIGTATTANIGATTTNGAAGTLYVVRATTNIFSGVTAAQVKAGQNASGNTTGVTATNGAVATTTPTVAQSSLTGGTLYYYAVTHEDPGGLSNVVTGSFTTATATRSASFNLDASAGVPLAVNIKYWTKVSKAAAATDGGSGGIDLAPGADGLFSLSGLAIAAGAGYVQFMVNNDENNIHVIPVTFA